MPQFKSKVIKLFGGIIMGKYAVDVEEILRRTVIGKLKVLKVYNE